MDFIIDQIAVGSYEDAINLQVLQANDITAVLDLAREVSYSLPPSILRLKIPLEDRVPMKQEYIRLAVNWLRNAAEERRVLVHCLAGISRSVTIVMCYLHEVQGFSLEDAYGMIRSKRFQANPHPALLDSIHEYYEVENKMF
ncbi:MAG: dual specificity protein phosphatase family protein [Candidatus Latescibacteria bacterium]|nr:dual specificity protein phosphatase family protein [Candidatus Latescibacterota bacterium]